MRVFAVFIIFGFGASLSQARPLCVIKSGAKLRESPFPAAEVTWRVPKFMPLWSTGNGKGYWIEVVDMDGEKHWAFGRDVSGNVRCLVVKSQRARLHAGPANRFPASNAGVADRYTTFRDLGGEDGWTKVEDEIGQSGWINLDQTWKPVGKVKVIIKE